MTARPAWMDAAECTGTTRIFYPNDGERATHARAICAGCPVRRECLDHALANDEQHGIWGGYDVRERRQERNRRRRAHRWQPRGPRPATLPAGVRDMDAPFASLIDALMEASA